MTQGDSSAPAAISALVLMLKASPELAGVLVLDGPEAVSPEAQQVIMVGAADDEDDTSAEHVITGEGYAGVRDRESVDIRCKLAVLNGDADIAAARAAAYGLFAAVRRVIIADTKLRGTVMTAGTSGASLRQDMTTGGARAQLRFTVACDAYTT